MNLVDLKTSVDIKCIPTANVSMNKNKLARSKLSNTASSSRTQLIVTQEAEQQQLQRINPTSPSSDTQVEPTKDASFLNYDDLILSQNYNPNSDVAWQVASPEVLRRIHKAITKNQRLRNNRRKSLTKDGNDPQLATEETKSKSPAMAKPKKRSKMKKRFHSNIENIIKTIEMKIKSDEYLANSDLSSQRNSTNSNSSPSCFEACHFHSSECNSIPDKDCGLLDGIKQTTSDDIEASQTYLLPSDCKNVDEKVTWSEDELLNESLMETVLIDNCMDSLKEKSSVMNTAFTIQNGEAKLQSPKIQNNLKHSNQSSSKKNSNSSDKSKTMTCKNQMIISSESMSSSSDDMNLSDSEIDEMLSQLQETDLVAPEMSKMTMNANSEIVPVSPGALDVEQFYNNRLTRLMTKKANEQFLEISNQINQKPLTKSDNNRTNECEMSSTKPYFLRNSTTKKTDNSANSKASVPVNNSRQYLQYVPKRGEDLFEDSEITDELLVDIYEDIFKDDMQDDDGSIANNRKGPCSSAKDISERVVPKTNNPMCSKEEIERKKLEAMNRRNDTCNKKQKFIC